jgi:hypothetical protein
MKDLNEVINKIINKAVVGCDKYVHNDSTWLIFTDDKKWVIELTKDGTLWYNYDFFKNLFKVLSLDVVENQNYITKWVEETIINGVRNTIQSITQQRRIVEDTIENGVKETHSGCDLLVDDYIEDTIQNGVKYTRRNGDSMNTDAEDAIQNGVKEIHWVDYSNLRSVEDTIQNGVKHTEYGDWLDGDERFDDIIQNGVKHTVASDCLPSFFVEDTIQNGVKHTEKSLQIDGSCVVEDVIQNGIKETHDDVYHHKGRVGGVIKNGVKQCIPSHTPLYNPMDFSVVYRENHRLDDVASVLEKGIKEVQPLPSQEGNMDWGNYYHRQEDRTKPHTKYVDDVITNGIKKTKAMDEWVNTTNIVGKVIDNGIKE